MKFIELTIHQHDSTPQDPGIAINAESIISFRSYRYSSGAEVTSVLLNTGERLDVKETYKQILAMIRKSK